MTVALNLKPEVEVEGKASPKADAVDLDLQEQIDRMIAEAVRNQPPPLSREEQIKKNRVALAVLRQWREEDKTEDPEEIARRQAEWDEFKAAMNESHTSDRIIYP